MEETNSIATEKKWYKRKSVRFVSAFLFVLLLLQAVFYFGADLFLRNYLKEKVKTASEEKYVIDFERFHILFLQRGVSFKGLTINPVDEKIDLLDEVAYYKSDVPEITITGIRYALRKKEIVFGQVLLTEPSIDFRLKIEDVEIELEDESPLEILQKEIKKSFLESQINEIRINSLEIDNADLLIKNFIAQRSIKAENSSLKVKNIQLLKDREPSTPFNAEGFYFEIENFELLLADSVHFVKSRQLEVSSLEEFIRARDVIIEPDFSKPSQSYFQASLEDLLLTDADINKVFYTSEVEIGSLSLNRPQFDLFVEPRDRMARREEDAEPFDFYNLIEGLLKSIQINKLDIEEGVFSQRSIESPNDFRIKAQRIDFNMADFYVGPDLDKRENRFFYADQAKVALHGVELALADSLHLIHGEFVSLSSEQDQIMIEGFRLFPLEEIDSIRGTTLLEIFVPQLSITEAHLKRIYNDGIVDVSEIKVEKPEILLRDVQTKSDGSPSFDFPSFYREYLEGIYVNRFEIEEGSLTVDNRLRIRQDSLSFGKVNLVLENFAIDAQTETAATKSFFWAENLQLELQEYALKLADNLHVFKADKLFLDTKTSQLNIDGFAIQPFNPDQLQNILDRYGRGTSLNIYVPKFSAFGVNIREAYFDEVLSIDRITVPSPKINITRHRPAIQEQDQEEDQKVDQREILDLLTNYFKEVSIGSLSLQKGTLNYENNVRERLRTFSEDNVSISVRNFHISQDTDPENLRFLFSEEVDLGLNNYVFNIADGKYNILADRINFNTTREEIIASNVTLNPREDFEDKTSVTAMVPEMSFRGVDLEAFLFENTLNLEKVKLSDSQVKVLINKELEGKKNGPSRSVRRDRNLPKTIDVVSIDTIQAESAQFSLAYKESDQEMELLNTGVDIAFYDFLLDSSKVAKGEIAGFFAAMTVGIDEFWLTLNDSVHQVTFDKVELDTRYEGILINNFRIIPRDLFGKPGNPIFSGHIPAILIKTNSLADLQRSKDLWLTELRLFRPDIELFTDQEQAPKNESDLSFFESDLLQKFQLDEFEIVEGNLAFYQKDGSGSPREINNFNLGIQAIEIDLNDFASFNARDLINNNFEFSLSNYQILLEDSLNTITLGGVAVKGDEILLTDVVYAPRYGKYKFSRMVGFQTDVIHAKIPEIRIIHPDIEQLFLSEKLLANKVLVSGLDAEFFRDKRFEKKEGVFKPMPQALMKDLNFLVKSDTLMLENGEITYLEFPEQGMIPGEIKFSDLKASLIPFHLGKSEGEFSLDESKLLADAKINGEAHISLQGQLFFQPPYPMRINAQLGSFDLELINSILKSNAFVRVRGGRVNEADWYFTADENEAVGQMKILYDDLNLELLDERTLQRGRGRKGILTFVLNVFAVRSNNPRKFFNTTITSRIYHPRDKDRFIFNYWWRATVSGLQGSAGLGQPKAPRRKEED
jgi:hypothetical protein